MVAEAELTRAHEAGARFRSAIRAAHYDVGRDEVTFDIPWGKLVVPRADIPTFKDVPPSHMEDLYLSHTGLHIDALDLDVSSDGLLAEIFRNLVRSLLASH
jgi:hypothetical protein